MCRHTYIHAYAHVHSDAQTASCIETYGRDELAETDVFICTYLRTFTNKGMEAHVQTETDIYRQTDRKTGSYTPTHYLIAFTNIDRHCQTFKQTFIQSVSQPFLTVCLSVRWSVCLSLSVSQPVCLVSRSVCLSVSQPGCLSVNQVVSLSVCKPVYLCQSVRQAGSLAPHILPQRIIINPWGRGESFLV